MYHIQGCSVSHQTLHHLQGCPIITSLHNQGCLLPIINLPSTSSMIRPRGNTSNTGISLKHPTNKSGKTDARRNSHACAKEDRRTILQGRIPSPGYTPTNCQATNDQPTSACVQTTDHSKLTPTESAAHWGAISSTTLALSQPPPRPSLSSRSSLTAFYPPLTPSSTPLTLKTSTSAQSLTIQNMWQFPSAYFHQTLSKTTTSSPKLKTTLYMER